MGSVAGWHGLPVHDWPVAGGAGIGNARAFSLVEVIIVVSLLSVIVLGLVAMFGQTQRAFRLGMTQTDVLEGGRMATDLLRRELEQMTPCGLPRSGRLPNNTPIIQPNFFAWLQGYNPLIQPLPGSSSAPRTNFVEDLFFLSRQNQDWVSIGYFVRTRNPQSGALGMPLVAAPAATVGAGTLYRFETNAPALSGRTVAQMYDEFRAATLTELRASKILDGVVHFRIRPYDTNGVWIDRTLNSNITFTNGLYLFSSNALPASVEVELGILEDRAWERYKSLPDAAGQYRYLTNQAGRVHLFRQRISIRNVDPDAYR